MCVPATDTDEGCEGQPTYLTETVIRSCTVPKFRGASNTDRSTWDAKVSSRADANGVACDT